MGTGNIEIDLHGLRAEEAKKKIDQAIKAADKSVYRIKLIHGYNRGKSLMHMIQDEYRYDRRIKRIMPGDNPGITVLVIRGL